MRNVTKYSKAILLLTATMVVGCFKWANDGIIDRPTPMEAVDLGLPSGVLWASQNLQADRPWAPGGKFKWGQQQDSKLLRAENDTVSILLGDDWRMPTRWDCYELMEYCRYEKKSIKGVRCYRFTSKVNSNSIYIPYGKGSFIFLTDSFKYWTSCASNQKLAVLVHFNKVYLSHSVEEKKEAWYIRPVKGPRVPLEKISLKQKKLTFPAGTRTQIEIDLTPFNAWNKRLFWESHDEKVAYVDQEGQLTALYPGQTTLSVVSEELGHGIEADITVSEYVTPQRVDMELPSGLLWADRNLGAVAETDDGLQFAWGEIRPQVLFTYDDYQGNPALPKDGSLPPDCDAATMILGPGWRIPSLQEFSELVENSTISYVYDDKGTDDYILTSKHNGNLLRLRMSGRRAFWTSTPANTELKTAFTIGSGENDIGYYPVDYPELCYQGLTIRPVFGDAPAHEDVTD